MYICAFNFDVNWFTTLPGMLIAGGVVLLLLSFILFVSSGHKKKVKKEEVVTTNVAPNFYDPTMNANVGIDPNMNQTFNNNPTMTSINDNVNTNPMINTNTMVDPSINQNISSQNISVDPMTVQQEAVHPVEFNSNPSVVSPINNQFINETPVTPVDVTPISPVMVNEEVPPVDTVSNTNIENNSINPVEVVPTSVDVEIPDVPVVNSNIEATDIASADHSVDIEKNIDASQNEEQPVIPSVEPTTTIYGGESPTVDFKQEESSHQIYGGANPLDKTQTIPIINDVPVQNIAEEENQMMEQTQEIPVVNKQEPPVYPEAKLVEDKDIEVLDF